MDVPRVGKTIQSGDGTEYIVSQIWEHKKHYDLALFNKGTGEPGDLRIMKPLNIFLDSSCTHLFPRWYHKFMFWRKFKYPSCIQKRKFLSYKTLKGKGIPDTTNHSFPRRGSGVIRDNMVDAQTTHSDANNH